MILKTRFARNTLATAKRLNYRAEMEELKKNLNDNRHKWKQIADKSEDDKRSNK